MPTVGAGRADVLRILMSHALPDLSVLRSHLRSRDRDRGTGGGVGPRRRGGRLQPRLHLPEGVRDQAAPRGPGPADDAARAPRRRAASRRAGTRRSRRSTGGSRRSSPSTAGTRWPSTSATRTRTTCPRSLTGRRGCACSARRTSTRRRPSTRCRSRSSPGYMFGTMLSVPIPDVDRCDHLLLLGANPLVSNGSLLTAPEHARPAARDPRARRQGRGGGPAPHAHRRGGRRAPLHPARHRRAAARRDRVHDRRGGPRRPGRARRAR